MKELASRILISLIFIPLLILALWFESWPMFFVFFLLTVLGSHEYYLMLRKREIKIPLCFIVISPLIYCCWVMQPQYQAAILWFGMLIFVVEALLRWDESSSAPRLFATMFGIFYTAVLPAMLVSIAWHLSVKKILLALILLIWIVDTMAYFIGMLFGKKRGVIAVSPRKSREGFIAGAISPVFVVLALYLGGFRYFTLVELVLLVIAAGVIGQLGDLLESMLKRFCGVKDSSRLIPGHGGILDRADSILLAGSFLYVTLLIVT